MRNRNAAFYYLFLQGFSTLAFTLITIVNLIYQVETVHLNALQLVLVGTVLEASAFLFEIPTGIVADLYSRRLSVLIGLVLIGLGFTLEGLIPFFWAVAATQVIWGIGFTFTSGAQEAWLADEIGEERMSPILLRAEQISQLCMLLAIPLSVGLALIQINLPIVIGGLLHILLAIFLFFTMPEDGFHPLPREEREGWRQMGQTLREGIKAVRFHPVLLTLFLATAFAGMSSEGYDRLWTKHMLDTIHLPALWHLPVVMWFGIISMVTALLSILAMEIIQRRVDTLKHAAWTLLLLDSARMVTIGVFALAGQFGLAVAAVLATSLVRTIRQPIYTSWLNQRLDSNVRATINSLASQVDALGQIIGGPFIGLIATIGSLRGALVATALVLLPTLIFYSALTRRKPAPLHPEAS